MGTVFRARDSRLGRPAALKVLNPDLANDTFIERFRREAEAAAALEHEHIVPLYDFGSQNGLMYIAMALKSGGNLADVIRRGNVSLTDTLRYLEEVGSALDYAHSKGIFHRDLKPANILLDEKGATFLTDFGIARRLGEARLTSAGTVVGSPTYMSPEAWRGEDPSSETDVYSLGVILFELLTGRPPYYDKVPMQLMLKHFNEPIPSVLQARGDLTPAVDNAVQKALAKDRSDRFRSAQEMVDVLRPAISWVISHSKRSGNDDEGSTAILDRSELRKPRPLTVEPPPAASPSNRKVAENVQSPGRVSGPMKPLISEEEAPAPRPDSSRLVLIGMGVVIAILLLVVILLLLNP